jgi:hypothetical protein
MKTVLSVILVLGILSAPIFAVAADPVDLRGKQGVVDPKDLKKYDPKPPKVEKQAPPPPEKSDKQKERDENYTVHKTGEGHGGVPTSGGFKP